MDKKKQEFLTRSERNKSIQPNNRKMDRLLNYLIALVSILIVITAIIIFSGDDETPTKPEQASEVKDQIKQDEPQEEDSSTDIEDSEEVKENEDISLTEQITELPSDDPIVVKAIVDTSWEPHKTTQIEPHATSYNPKSIDWQEQVTTLLTTTGLSEDDYILWWLGSDGTAQTSKGVISSKDKKEMYRISLKWIENEGWKPVRMEILNTIQGAY